MACIRKKKLNDGTISYRIQVKAKDLRTGEFVAKSMCWRKPSDLTEIQAKKELQRICLDFEDKFKKQLNGMLAIDNDPDSFMLGCYTYSKPIPPEAIQLVYKGSGNDIGPQTPDHSDIYGA